MYDTVVSDMPDGERSRHSRWWHKTVGNLSRVQVADTSVCPYKCLTTP